MDCFSLQRVERAVVVTFLVHVKRNLHIIIIIVSRIIECLP